MYLIQDVIGYSGRIVFDKSKPDGTFRKKMDNSIIKNLGFFSTTTLEKGIEQTYNWYINNI
jgi:GDP-L-fucose synthase